MFWFVAAPFLWIRASRNDGAQYLKETPENATKKAIPWLKTVFSLNLSINALWISFLSVSDKSAAYYGKDFEAIDWLGTIGFIVG